MSCASDSDAARCLRVTVACPADLAGAAAFGDFAADLAAGAFLSAMADRLAVCCCVASRRNHGSCRRTSISCDSARWDRGLFIACACVMVASHAWKGSAMYDVHYWPTPNGKKVTILLEELGVKYKVVPCNIGRGDQFSD